MTFFAPRTILHPCRFNWTRCWLVASALLLCAVAQAAQSVTLAWDLNSEPELAGYKLYYGAASGLYTSTNSVGRMTNAAGIM